MLSKSDAISALRETNGDLTNRALKRAGLYRNQATRLRRVLDSCGCTVRGAGGQRMLTVTLDHAVRAITEIDDPLQPLPFTVTYVPPRPGGNSIQAGDEFSRLLMCDILQSYQSEYDGVELERGGESYRLYQGELYRIDENGRMRRETV
jgi:hypothetical protein